MDNPSDGPESREAGTVREVPPELMRGPFTVARAHELGVTRTVLAGARFRAPWPGVRVPAHLPDSLRLRCAAAELAIAREGRRPVFAGPTAVLLSRLPTPLRPIGAPAPDPLTEPLHVALPPDAPRPRLDGVIAHRLSLGPDEVRPLDGLLVTSPERTWRDLGAELDVIDLVALADAVRARTPDGAARLRAQLAGARRGQVRLSRALVLSRDGVDSPMETRLRLLLAVARVPEPVVNRPVFDANGAYVHQPDLSWPRWKVALEYDGAHHLTWDDERDVLAGRATNRRRALDISRQEQLALCGWRVCVVTAYDVLARPQATVSRVVELLRAAGASVTPKPITDWS